MIIVVSIIIAILLWSMSDVAWAEGRPTMAWVYLFLSALNGALVMSAIF